MNKISSSLLLILAIITLCYSQFTESKPQLINDLEINGREIQTINNSLSVSDLIYMDLDSGALNSFTSVPAVVEGITYLPSFYGDSANSDEEYLLFTANENIKVSLFVSSGATVDDSLWEKQNEGFDLSPYMTELAFENGVDIYTRYVRKDSLCTIAGNREFTDKNEMYLIFIQSDDRYKPIKINFSLPGIKVSEAYLIDTGNVYVEKRSGYSYGWIQQAKDGFLSDVESASYLTIDKSNSWGIKLKNGMYRIKVHIDESNANTVNLKINGIPYKFSKSVFSSNASFVVDDYVTVTEETKSLCTIENVSNSPIRLSYVEIEPIGYTVPSRFAIAQENNPGINAENEKYILKVQSTVSDSSHRSLVVLSAGDIPQLDNIETASLAVCISDLHISDNSNARLMLYAVNNATVEDYFTNASSDNVDSEGEALTLNEDSEFISYYEVTQLKKGYIHLDIREYLESNLPLTNISFVLMFEEGETGRDLFSFLSKEAGVNSPYIEIHTTKKWIKKDGLLIHSNDDRTVETRAGVKLNIRDSYATLDSLENNWIRFNAYLAPLDNHADDQIVIEAFDIVAPQPNLVPVEPWSQDGKIIWNWDGDEVVTKYRYKVENATDNKKWIESTETGYSVKSPLPEGEYTFLLSAKSSRSGWSKPDTSKVIVDKTAPKISAIKTEELGNGNYKISWIGNDNLCKSDEIEVQYRITHEADSENHANISWNKAESSSVETYIEVGKNSISIKATDPAGNERIVTEDLIITTDGPVFTSLDYRTFTNEKRPAITWVCIDGDKSTPVSDLKFKCELFKDGKSIEKVRLDKSVQSYTPEKDLADGEYVFTIEAKDKDSNKLEKRLSFVVDTKAPVISSFTCEDGVYRWIVTDQNYTGSSLTYEYKQNEQGGWIQINDSTLNIGSNEPIEFRVTDRAGNVTSTNSDDITVLLKFDNGVEISLPNGAYPKSKETRGTDRSSACITVSNGNKKVRGYGSSDSEIPGSTNRVKLLSDTYVCLPHMKFKKNITMKLPFTEEVLQEDANKVMVFYYNEVRKKWEPVKSKNLDLANKTISCETDHFSFYAVGMLNLATEPPQAQGINTKNRNISKVDPMKGIREFPTPSANNRGTNSLYYPLDFPAGINGATPSVGLSYNNEVKRGNMCVPGWNLSTGSSITIDTKKRLPNYGENYLDSNTFLLDGKELVHLGGGEFRLKVEGEFLKVNFNLEKGQVIVYYPNGSKYYYGNGYEYDDGDVVFPENSPLEHSVTVPKILNDQKPYTCRSPYCKDEHEHYVGPYKDLSTGAFIAGSILNIDLPTEDGSVVKAFAGREINLLPGFSTGDSSTFEATVGNLYNLSKLGEIGGGISSQDIADAGISPDAIFNYYTKGYNKFSIKRLKNSKTLYNPKARVDHVRDLGKHTFEWKLDRIEDKSGNKISYEYKEVVNSNGELINSYPQTIRYGYTDASTYMYSISLNWNSALFKSGYKGPYSGIYGYGIDRNLKCGFLLEKNQSLKNVYAISHIGGSIDTLKRYDLIYNDGALDFKVLRHLKEWSPVDNKFIHDFEFTYDETVDSIFQKAKATFTDQNLTLSNGTTRDFVDLNGDGLPDRIKLQDKKMFVEWNYGEYGIRTRHFFKSAVECSGTLNYQKLIADCSGFSDINNDGLMDRLVKDNANSNKDFRVYYNRNGAFSSELPIVYDTLLKNTDKYNLNSGQEAGFTDFNGDGFPDRWAVIPAKTEQVFDYVDTSRCYTEDEGNSRRRVHDHRNVYKTVVLEPAYTKIFYGCDINDTLKCPSSTRYTSGTVSFSNNSGYRELWFQDFNGDGLTDFIKGSKTMYHYGNTAMISIGQNNNPKGKIGLHRYDNGWVNIVSDFIDLNGDGLLDIYHKEADSSEVYYLNYGDIYRKIFALNSDSDFSGKFLSISKGSDVYSKFMDIDGDGAVDHVKNVKTSSGFTYKLNKLAYKNTLIGVKNTITNNEQAFTYDRVYIDPDRSKTKNYRKVRVLSSAKVFNTGWKYEQSRNFKYHNGVYDRLEKEFRGFEKVTESVDDSILQEDNSYKKVTHISETEYEVKRLQAIDYQKNTIVSNDEYPRTTSELENIDFTSGAHLRKGYDKYGNPLYCQYSKGHVLSTAQKIKIGNKITTLDSSYYSNCGIHVMDFSGGNNTDPKCKIMMVYPRSIKKWFYNDHGVLLDSGVVNSNLYYFNKSDGLLDSTVSINYGDPLNTKDDVRSITSYNSLTQGDTWANTIKEKKILDNSDISELSKSKYFYSTSLKLDSTSVWMNTNNVYLTTKYHYDSYGNVSQEVSPTGSSTEYQRVFNTGAYSVVVTKTDPLGLEKTLCLDKKGFLIVNIDHNNDTTAITYDAYGRILEDSSTINGSKILCKKFIYSTDTTNGGIFQVDVSFRESVSSNNMLRFKFIKDPLRRNLQQLQYSTVKGTDMWIVSPYIERDASGRAITIGAKTTRNDSSYENNKDGSITDTTTMSFRYDSLGRFAKVVAPNGYTLNKSYNKDTLTGKIVNRNTLMSLMDSGQYRKNESLVDMQGKVIRTVKGEEGKEYLTDYTFNLDGTSTVTEPKLVNNSRAVGKKKVNSLGQVEWIITPDAGLIHYEYNNVGNIVKEVKYGTTYDTSNLDLDTTKQEIHYTYDRINRLTSIVYGAGKENLVYEYYSENSPKYHAGAIRKISMGDFFVEYAYGQDWYSETKMINGVSYCTKYSYDLQGKISSIQYPDNSIVNYSYNTGGLLDSIPGFVTGIEYNEYGQRTKVINGNGQVTRYSYDARSKLLDQMTVSQKNGTEVLKLDYDFSIDGNLLQLNDLVQSGSLNRSEQAYTYDHQGRITSSSGTSGDKSFENYYEAYTFDPMTRMTKKYVSSDSLKYLAFEYNGTSHAISSITASDSSFSKFKKINYSYDDFGNMIQKEMDSSITSMSYNNANRLSMIQYPSGDAKWSKYFYDNKGNRIVKIDKKGNDTTTSIFVNGFYNLTNGIKTRHVSDGQNIIASECFDKANIVIDTIYYSQNNIGSTTLLTNKTGSLQKRYLYKPFGETWIDDGQIDFDLKRRFTGQMFDEESGLYYMNARYYDPQIGTFLRPDPAMDGLNHYGYVSGNPIFYTDPTGLERQMGLSDYLGLFRILNAPLHDFGVAIVNETSGYQMDDYQVINADTGEPLLGPGAELVTKIAWEFAPKNIKGIRSLGKNGYKYFKAIDDYIKGDERALDDIFWYGLKLGAQSSKKLKKFVKFLDYLKKVKGVVEPYLKTDSGMGDPSVPLDVRPPENGGNDFYEAPKIDNPTPHDKEKVSPTPTTPSQDPNDTPYGPQQYPDEPSYPGPYALP